MVAQVLNNLMKLAETFITYSVLKICEQTPVRMPTKSLLHHIKIGFFIVYQSETGESIGDILCISTA